MGEHGEDRWSVIRQKDGAGKFVADHVVPTIDIDGRQVLSAVHELNEQCPCRPIRDTNGDGQPLWIHHDPDHPNALSEEEYQKRRTAAK